MKGVTEKGDRATDQVGPHLAGQCHVSVNICFLRQRGWASNGYRQKHIPYFTFEETQARKGFSEWNSQIQTQVLGVPNLSPPPPGYVAFNKVKLLSFSISNADNRKNIIVWGRRKWGQPHRLRRVFQRPSLDPRKDELSIRHWEC